MHPYDATNYHDLENCGEMYRERMEKVIERLDNNSVQFVTAENISDLMDDGFDNI